MLRHCEAYAPTSNIAGHFYHEKSDSQISMSMGLHLAAFWAAGALLLRNIK